MNIIKRFELKGKKALITGGSRGIGKSVAFGLAEAGADIIIVSRDKKKGKKTADEIIQKTGVKAIAIEADVSKPDDVNIMIDNAIDALGTVDIAFNNAGIANSAKAEDMTYEEWKTVIDTNLTGVFLTSQAAGRVMVKNKGGSIINMASMSAHIINEHLTVCNYHAAKAGVIHLTKALASEWAKHNVRVNSISPGYHYTELSYKFEDQMKLWGSRIPLGRLGNVEELQGLVLFLASDASTYITGTDIISDGGYTIW